MTGHQAPFRGRGGVKLEDRLSVLRLFPIVHQLRNVGWPQQLQRALVREVNGGLAEGAQAHATA